MANPENDREMNDDGSRTADTRAEPPERSCRQFYRALASRERRRLLALLLDCEERSVEDVATLLVGCDARTGTIEGPERRERTLLRLVHAHLPMLQEAGLVTYNPERGTVRVESLAPETVEYIERSLDDGEESWA